MKRFTLVLLPFLIALMAVAKSPDASIPLKPESTQIFVATPEESPALFAGGLVQNWLRKASGVETGFELTRSAPKTGAPAEGTTWILINDPQLPLPPELASDGFVLRTSANTIQLRGKKGDAVVFAAVEMLRQLGINFYLPGDLFTTLPETKELRMPQVDIVSSPFTTSLFFSGITSPEGQLWSRLNAMNRRKGGTHQHNSYDMFPPEKFAERFPDIYPIQSGKRFIPPNAKDQSWQPNFLSPNIVDAAMESIREHFQKQPNDEYIAVSIQDGRGFCQGPETMEIVEKFRSSGVDAPTDRAHSFIYWNKFIRPLAERLAQEFPDKYLVALAYAGTRFPPSEPLPDNVVVFTNFHIAEYATYADQVKEVEKAGGKASDIEGGPDHWLSLVEHYGNHDWYQGSGYLMPRSYSGNWREYLQRVKAGAKDAFMHVETYPNWGFDGHKYYILSRMLWNPDLDPKALSKQMCVDLFGPAAGPMEEYFDLQESLWLQLNHTEGPERKLASWDRAYVTTETSRQMIKRARQLLDEAAKLAGTPEQKARVELYSDCFAIAEMMFDMAAWEKFDAERVKEYSTRAQAIVDKHGAMALMHRNTLEGIPFLGAHMLRALAPDMQPDPIADRDSLLPIGDPAWENVTAHPFSMQDGSEDPQETTVRIARDSGALYLLVQSPLKRERKLVIDERTTWRSDNIELKIDTDDNWGSLEGQFWIKPNGMLVDFQGREERVGDATPLEAESDLNNAQWTVSMRIPIEYFGMSKGHWKPIGVQVFRNEFKEIPGFFQTDYVAVWAGKIASE
jgi:hypothetical protein